MARGPTWAAAAPSASEVCSGWRPCTRLPHERQRRTSTLNWVVIGRGSGSSVWNCSAIRSSSVAPPQPGAFLGGGGAQDAVGLDGRRHAMAVLAVALAL